MSEDEAKRDLRERMYSLEAGVPAHKWTGDSDMTEQQTVGNVQFGPEQREMSTDKERLERVEKLVEGAFWHTGGPMSLTVLTRFEEIATKIAKEIVDANCAPLREGVAFLKDKLEQLEQSQGQGSGVDHQPEIDRLKERIDTLADHGRQNFSYLNNRFQDEDNKLKGRVEALEKRVSGFDPENTLRDMKMRLEDLEKRPTYTISGTGSVTAMPDEPKPEQETQPKMRHVETLEYEVTPKEDTSPPLEQDERIKFRGEQMRVGEVLSVLWNENDELREENKTLKEKLAVYEGQKFSLDIQLKDGDLYGVITTKGEAK